MDAVVSVADFIAQLKREGLVIISEAHLAEADRNRERRALKGILREKRFLTYAEIVQAGIWNVKTVKGVRSVVLRELNEGEDYIISSNGNKPVTKVMRAAVERIMLKRGVSWNC